MSDPNPPSSEHQSIPGRGTDRGMIPREELPFLPKIRWQFWIPIIAFFATLIIAYIVVENKRTKQTRALLLREHAQRVGALGRSYRELRTKVEQLTFSVIGPWDRNYVDPTFTYQELTRNEVLYGRVRLGEIHQIGDVNTSIRHRYPEQIAQCLGIPAVLMHQVYNTGDFLMPDYVDGVRNVDDNLRLQMLRSDLDFRIQRDYERIARWTLRRYFVLAVDEAALSIDGATRVYIWDLQTNRQVLRARSRGDSVMLIPMNISGVTQARATPQQRLTVTEHDCSVANAVKELLGVDILAIRDVDRPTTDVSNADGGTARPGLATALPDGAVPNSSLTDAAVTPPDTSSVH